MSSQQTTSAVRRLSNLLAKQDREFNEIQNQRDIALREEFNNKLSQAQTAPLRAAAATNSNSSNSNRYISNFQQEEEGWRIESYIKEISAVSLLISIIILLVLISRSLFAYRQHWLNATLIKKAKDQAPENVVSSLQTIEKVKTKSILDEIQGYDKQNLTHLIAASANLSLEQKTAEVSRLAKLDPSILSRDGRNNTAVEMLATFRIFK